jgi:hypothetical protein
MLAFGMCSKTLLGMSFWAAAASIEIGVSVYNSMLIIDEV